MTSRNKFFSKLAILTAMGISCLAGIQSHAATFTWNGAGVTGGTGDTDWNAAANWNVSGVDGDGIPDADDNVDIFFDTNYGGGSHAVIVPNGATASRVRLDGYGGTGRSVQIGTTSGDVINWGKSQAIDVNNSSESWRIISGATLNLIDSGSLADPTWTMGRSTSSLVQGTLNLTSGGVIYVDNDLNASPAFQSGIRFTNPTSTVQFDIGSQLMNAGSGTVEFRSTQTITGLTLLQLNSGTLASGDGGPLNNFSDVRLRKDSNDNRGGSADFAGGTYRALIVSDRVGQTAGGSPSLRATGDVTFVGSSGSGTPGGDGAIEVYMQDNRTDTGTFTMRGHDLTVSSASPVIVGTSTANNTNVLDLRNPAGSGTNGTTATIASDLIFNSNGEIRGDAETVIELAGNFQNASTRNTGFDLEASTLHMNGAGTMVAPQFLEVQGLDVGESVGGLVDNFGVADLVIGMVAQPTYVQLNDQFDFQTDSLADALYVSSLTVNAGSTLDLNGYRLYEGGVRVRGGRIENPFVTAQGGFIIDSTLPPVPEPGSLCLLGLGVCLLAMKRRRGKSNNC